MFKTRRQFATLAVSAALIGLSTLGTSAQTPSKLVLYTSQPDRDAQQTVAGFRRLYPWVEVEVFRSGTTEVMSKLAAEIAAGQPRPDLLFIADAASMEILKAQGHLEPYKEAKVDGIPAELIDPDRTYFGTKMISTGIIYNTAAKNVPTSWADLAKPEYKGQISMPSPLYSGAAAIKFSAVGARPDLGWKFIEGLKANDASAVRGNGAVLRAVATGEKTYGIIVDFMAYNAKKQGSPVEFVFPKEGVTVVTEPVAILKTSQNKTAAKQFVDYLLSDDGQRLSLTLGYLASREKVGRPDWLPAGTTINLMPVDMKGVVKTIEDDKKRFGAMFGQ